MSSVNASDIPEIQQFMGVFWTAIKKFYGVEMTDEYSAEVHEYLSEIIDKFPNPLCKELTLVFYKHISSEQMEMFREERRQYTNEQQT